MMRKNWKQISLAVAFGMGLWGAFSLATASEANEPKANVGQVTTDLVSVTPAQHSAVSSPASTEKGETTSDVPPFQATVHVRIQKMSPTGWQNDSDVDMVLGLPEYGGASNRLGAMGVTFSGKTVTYLANDHTEGQIKVGKTIAVMVRPVDSNKTHALLTIDLSATSVNGYDEKSEPLIETYETRESVNVKVGEPTVITGFYDGAWPCLATVTLEKMTD